MSFTAALPTRRLGRSGLEITVIGFGAPTVGGLYLGGEDTCELGMGGP